MIQSPPSAAAQRPIQSQRRQQNHPDQMQASPTAMNTSSGTGSEVRSSSGSGRSQRSANPDKQISQIEKSVTHLLVATKQLLETLTQWSRGQAQEEEVSDVYVRLGYEFNLACRAFNSIGVETSDLGPVPDLLRSILEDTLSQPASPQALDNYLPRIRDIIINLLHGLKRKQSRLRGRTTKETGAGQTRAPISQIRQTSVSTTASSETGLTHMLEDIPSATSSMRGPPPQQESTALSAQTYEPANASAVQASKPPIGRQSLRRNAPPQLPESDSTSTMSSSTAENIPVLPPYHDVDQPLLTPSINFPHPPPPPPKETDALTRLQRGGDLERRASRRFSAYQIQKHLGASPNGVPVIPPAQNSPIPNRGKEVRESLSAVRSRGSFQQSRSRSVRQADASPGRSGTVRAPQRISEEAEQTPVLSLEAVPPMRPPEEPLNLDSPTVKTPDEYHKPPVRKDSDGNSLVLGATVNGPLEPTPEELQDTASVESQPAPQPPEHKTSADQEFDESTPETVQREPREIYTPPQSQVVALDSSPPQGKELTLFLQYRSKIKKFVLADGYAELTIPRLQLAFIEKFAWNTQHDGGELPEIYVQDPVSGVRHELEDLSDVKDRSVLVLNVEPLDEVKKHIDEGLGGLHRTIEGVRSLLEGQGTLMQRFSDRQLETSKEMARMSAVPSTHPSRTPTLTTGPFSGSAGPSAPSASNLQEIQDLRRDIAVLRQTYSTMSSDFSAAMTDIKAKAANVKIAAAEATNASYKGDVGRAHINEGKKALSDDSETLVSRVDDLSDIVEELRKDVVQRGVRPLPRQLEDISKEISGTTKHLSKVKEFVKREKPVWTKIWEQELQVVMTERDDLTQQDELLADLDGDLEDITNVFKLVEEATKQQNLQNTTTGGRNPSKSIPFDPDVDPHEAKTGMLDEVRALQPNHESRLEAIERAEKVRQREMQTRKVGEFQREVENFVEEGKLKKTGGMDEVERRRKMRDELARKENWDRQQARAADLEKKRAEEAAAAAAAAASSAETNGARHESDTSQEGEAAFQDANEENVQSPEGRTSPTPDPLAIRGAAIDEQPAPQLPEVIAADEKGLGMSFLNV
ncbi:actin interacting protein 3-domain-containing protein [Exophiala viscosa]|uniref:Actin interacting protein 3-domain-containing protein n=1 Tax=Exophiala viscosa TaxID=2486360 RepID=A0AAN6E0M9_9EURO|nr:actin interacting protein 3-domain-containing protein [Exophiala viscosa]